VALAALVGLTGVAAHGAPASAAGNPVLLVHGFSLTGGHDCGAYFSQLKSYIQGKGRTVYTVGYYAGNTNCDLEVPGHSNNTTSTSLERLGYEFSRLLIEEFDGQAVDIVAHSMGGLVVRDALDDQGPQLTVDEVVTLGSPHAGASSANLINLVTFGTCALIRQCADMTSGSSFLSGLEHNPQSSIPTRWTLVGSVNDEVVGPGTGVAMGRGSSWKPSVSSYEYASNARTDNNCWGYAPVDHGDLAENRATGRCTWSWRGATYSSLTRPAQRAWNGIAD
jgi:hypothetical protein